MWAHESNACGIEEVFQCCIVSTDCLGRNSSRFLDAENIGFSPMKSAVFILWNPNCEEETTVNPTVCSRRSRCGHSR